MAQVVAHPTSPAPPPPMPFVVREPRDGPAAKEAPDREDAVAERTGEAARRAGGVRSPSPVCVSSGHRAGAAPSPPGTRRRPGAGRRAEGPERSPSPPPSPPSPKRTLDRTDIEACPSTARHPPRRQFFRLGRGRGGEADLPRPASHGSLADLSPPLSPQPQADGGAGEAGPARPPSGARMRKFKLRKPAMLRRRHSFPCVSKVPSLGGGSDAERTDRTAEPSERSAATADEHGAPEGREKSSLRRSVTFSCVHIRTHSVVLGDHPSCPSGPPLALGWDVACEDCSVDLSRYEEDRAGCRRRPSDLRVGAEARRSILCGLVRDVPASPGSDGDGECCGSCRDGEAAVEHVYTERDIRRAERQLVRERSCNARAARRVQRGFFRPVTDALEAAVDAVDGGADGSGEEGVGAADAPASPGGGESPSEGRSHGPAAGDDDGVVGSDAAPSPSRRDVDGR